MKYILESQGYYAVVNQHTTTFTKDRKKATEFDNQKDAQDKAMQIFELIMREFNVIRA